MIGGVYFGQAYYGQGSPLLVVVRGGVPVTPRTRADGAAGATRTSGGSGSTRVKV